MKFLQMYILEIQTLMTISHMTVLIQNLPKKKNMFYNLAKRTVVFLTDPEKVELRLWNLATNNKYPDHIISNAF